MAADNLAEAQHTADTGNANNPPEASESSGLIYEQSTTEEIRSHIVLERLDKLNFDELHTHIMSLLPAEEG